MQVPKISSCKYSQENQKNSFKGKLEFDTFTEVGENLRNSYAKKNAINTKDLNSIKKIFGNAMNIFKQKLELLYKKAGINPSELELDNFSNGNKLLTLNDGIAVLDCNPETGAPFIQYRWTENIGDNLKTIMHKTYLFDPIGNKLDLQESTKEIPATTSISSIVIGHSKRLVG